MKIRSCLWLLLLACLPMAAFTSCEESEDDTGGGGFSDVMLKMLSDMSDNKCIINGTPYNIVLTAEVRQDTEHDDQVEPGAAYFNFEVVDAQGVSTGYYGHGDMSLPLLGKTINLAKPVVGGSEMLYVGLYDDNQNGQIALNAFDGDVSGVYGETEYKNKSCFKAGAMKVTNGDKFEVQLYGEMEDGFYIALKGSYVIPQPK